MILFNVFVRNQIYKKLIISFRDLFFEKGDATSNVNGTNFFEVFFKFIHNPHIDNLFNDRTTDHEMLFREFMDNQDIAEILLKNVMVFKNFMVRRKMLIEEVAKLIWMMNDQMDDISIWVAAEKNVEKDLIENLNISLGLKMGKIHSETILNSKCTEFDFNSGKYQPIFLQKKK